MASKLKIAGIVLHVLVVAVMLLACSGKAFGFAPEEVVKKMTEGGLGEQIRLIGAGGLLVAVLLLIPPTSAFGVLGVTAYWGGAICFDMAKHESYAAPAVFLLMTWLGAVLRSPGTYLGFASGKSPAVAEVASAG